MPLADDRSFVARLLHELREGQLCWIEAIAVAEKAVQVAVLARQDRRSRRTTDGIGADIALEVVGFPAVVEEGIKMVRMRGKYLEIGSIAENSFINIDTNYLVSQQIRMTMLQRKI